jgi:regulator of replication initiation timing
MATKTASPTAVEPIDRLEEKIKLLVSVIGRLRQEQSRVTEDNARLQRELESFKARIADAEGATREVVELRGERDQIRSRVSEMLQQLDALNL